MTKTYTAGKFALELYSDSDWCNITDTQANYGYEHLRLNRDELRDLQYVIERAISYCEKGVR